MDFQPISERICPVRLRGKYQKIAVINIHGATEEKEIEIKEQFYSELERIYERMAKCDLKIIIGDANVKLGREEWIRPTIGQHSKQEDTNENGFFLIDFARKKDMIIKSTYFQRK